MSGDATSPTLLRDDDVGVTAVVGTVLVVAITIIGIAGVLAFGVPAVTRLNDQAALQSMTGQFVDVRAATLSLSLEGSSTVPAVRLSTGSLGLESADRLLVVVKYDVACTLDLLDWTVANTQVNAAGSCAAVPCTGVLPCFRLFEVHGPSLREVPVLAPVIPGGLPATSDWLVRALDGAGNTQADAWVLSSERLAWRHSSSQSDMAAVLEWGAAFVRDRGDYRLKSPVIREDSTTGALAMRLVGFDGSAALSGAGDYGLVATLSSSVVRSTGTASSVHLEFAGEFAGTWCDTILARQTLDGAPANWWLQTPAGWSSNAGVLPAAPVGSTACRADPANPNVYAVNYDPSCVPLAPPICTPPTTPPAAGQFSTVILHATLDARFQL